MISSPMGLFLKSSFRASFTANIPETDRFNKSSARNDYFHFAEIEFIAEKLL